MAYGFMKYLLLILVAVAATASGSVCAAGDPAAGKSRSSPCTACHGFTGLSPSDQFPNLAGQKQRYLVPACQGERRGCFAITEANAGSDPRQVETSAVLKGDQWHLTGEK